MKVTIGNVVSRQEEKIKLAYDCKIRERQYLGTLSMILRLRSRKDENGVRSADLNHLLNFANEFIDHGMILHSYAFAGTAAGTASGEILSDEHIAKQVDTIEERVKHSKDMFHRIGIPLYVEKIPATNFVVMKEIRSWRSKNSMRSVIDKFQVPYGYMVSSVNGYSVDDLAYVSSFIYVLPMVRIDKIDGKIYWGGDRRKVTIGVR